MVDTVLQDLRYAVRGLARSPGFALAVMLTLGLGIGINAVAFGAIDALLLRPPAGVGDPDGAYRIDIRPPVRRGQPPVKAGTLGVTYPEFAALRDDGAFAALATYSEGGATLGRGAQAEQRSVVYVSREYFSTLRVRPALGRLFAPGPERELPPAAVLSHDYWRSRFGSDPGVVGRPLEVDGHTVVVLGVAGQGFNGVRIEPVAAWLTLSAASAVSGEDVSGDRGGYRFDLVGRPAPGLSPAAAAARLTARITHDSLGYAWRNGRGPYAVAFPLHKRYGADDHGSPIPPWVLWPTVVVLLVACANVAGLLLARGARRERELAVRLALGAGRGRIVRQLLTETLVLALAGSILGLLLSTWGGSLLPLIGAPRLDRLVDPKLVAGTAGVVVLVALLVGLLPALRASAVEVERVLKAGSPRATVARSRARAVLTVGQLALCLALLVSAGLFAQSLRNAWRVPLGFEADHLLVVNTMIPAGEATNAERAQLAERALERVRRLPGVAAAARASASPWGDIAFAGLSLPDGRAIDGLPTTAVGEDYFRTVGLRVLEGRGFDARDRRGSAPVVVVNRTLARMFWPRSSPIGQCVRVEEETACRTVVGVVDDVRLTSDLKMERPPQFYRPLADRPIEFLAYSPLLVRTAGQPADAAARVRGAVLTLDPRLLWVKATPFPDRIRSEVGAWRTAATVVSAAALLTLLLALVGVYGLIGFQAQARRREVGIRMALGARETQIQALVLREGVRLALAGTVLGIVLAAVAARLLRSRFYGVTGTEPITYVAAALLLACAALVATYLPARAAARANPLDALRAE